MKLTLLTLFAVISTHTMLAQKSPLKLGVVGLTHTHVHWILGYDSSDIEVVGYVEPNRALAQKYAEQYGFSMDLVYASMDKMYAAVEVEAVAAFGTIYDHLEVVQKSAPLGIHVMVEKPLAVSHEHGLEMAALAEKHKIHLVTNYETTWYPSNHKARQLLESGKVGEIRKIIIRDGHRGPKKIGVNSEFLEWLTDPVDNGGGAVVDFGCYGANLSTWIMKGEEPIAVTAIVQQLQKENNPRVDDESIIILEYEKGNALIQASWNWPMGRKDMEIYGLTGAIYSDNKNDLRVRIAEGYDGFQEEKVSLPDRPAPYDNPFSFFAAVISNEITLGPEDLSSIQNNLVVMKILDAARQSAEEGKRVMIK